MPTIIAVFWNIHKQHITLAFVALNGASSESLVTFDFMLCLMDISLWSQLFVHRPLLANELQF